MSKLPILPHNNPHKNQLDTIIGKILRRIREKKWYVSGMSIVRSGWKNLDEKEFLFVKEIHGKEFKLFFEAKDQILKGKKSDTTIISRIILPKEELVIDELRLLHYWQYIGNNWNEDCQWWLSTEKRKDTILQHYYWHGNVFLSGKYVDFADKPIQLLESDILATISNWLQKNVLNKIS